MIHKGGVVLGNGFKGSPGLKGLNTDDEVRGISQSFFGTPTADNKFDKAVTQV